MFTTRKIRTPDDLSLHVAIFGRWPDPAPDARPPILCLPGLTRNGRDFYPFAQAMAGDAACPRSVITIDARGRGGSDRDPDESRYTVPVEAGDVLAVMDALGIEKADFVGTSRGGLILHILAAQALPRLGRLVLNDIGPVIETEGLRQIQAYLDPSAPPLSRADVVSALKRVHGPSFPALDEADWVDMADALYRQEGERLVADYDPAIARQTRALDLSQPLPDLWALYDLMGPLPLAVIRGEHSALLSVDTVEAMRRHHPGLTVIEAAGQGHAPLLHRADVIGPLRAFLNR